MIDWLNKKAGRKRVLGIDMYDEGCAIAVLDATDPSQPNVTDVRWCSFDHADNRARVLKDAVRELGVRGLPTYATLAHSSYTLVQLEAPDLPLDEMREAVRWRVKDLIDFPVEEATVDVFSLPESRRAGAPALVYVVVARSREVEVMGDILADADLKIEAIDVVEMAIRNLSMHLDRPERPRAYLHLQPGQTIFEVADGPQVYLSRRVLQDFDPGAAEELLQAQMENLALEVQRSLDYFESQYAMGAADRLSVISCDNALYNAFGQVARNFLTVPTAQFDFTAVASSEGVELSTLGRGVTAIGAAMRGLPWAA